MTSHHSRRAGSRHKQVELLRVAIRSSTGLTIAAQDSRRLFETGDRSR
jgi:hypothetical protein